MLNGARYVDLAHAFSEPWVSVAGAAVAIALLVAAIRSFVMTGRLRQRLAVLELEHRLLAEHSSDIVLLVDAQGRVRWVSPAVRPVLGWSPTEWAGRSFVDFFAGGKDGHDVLRQFLRSPIDAPSQQERLFAAWARHQLPIDALLGRHPVLLGELSLELPEQRLRRAAEGSRASPSSSDSNSRMLSICAPGLMESGRGCVTYAVASKKIAAVTPGVPITG